MNSVRRWGCNSFNFCIIVSWIPPLWVWTSCHYNLYSQKKCVIFLNLNALVRSGGEWGHLGKLFIVFFCFSHRSSKTFLKFKLFFLLRQSLQLWQKRFFVQRIVSFGIFIFLPSIKKLTDANPYYSRELLHIKVYVSTICKQRRFIC
jgi:hypothetical protein